MNSQRFISSSYGLFFCLAVLFAIALNSVFVIYFALIALAAGLHYIEAHRTHLLKRFKEGKPLGFDRAANGLHIAANILLAVLVIKELLQII